MNYSLFFNSLDKYGVVQRVNYNNQVRDQFPVASLDDTHKLYKALKRFNDIAYSKDVMIKHKLKPGKNLNAYVFNEILYNSYSTEFSTKENYLLYFIL